MSIEAMKQALEAWQTSVYGSESHHKAMLIAMTNMAQAIEQAEKQEPYGYLRRSTGRFVYEVEGANPMADKQYLPLYTTPQPQREWVGLTDAEIEEFDYYARDLVMDIEKALKERNNVA